MLRQAVYFLCGLPFFGGWAYFGIRRLTTGGWRLPEFLLARPLLATGMAGVMVVDGNVRPFKHDVALTCIRVVLGLLIVLGGAVSVGLSG